MIASSCSLKSCSCFPIVLVIDLNRPLGAQWQDATARRAVAWEKAEGPSIRSYHRIVLIDSRFDYEQDHDHDHEQEPSQRD
jgi:hypothetical protein